MSEAYRVGTLAKLYRILPCEVCGLCYAGSADGTMCCGKARRLQSVELHSPGASFIRLPANRVVNKDGNPPQSGEMVYFKDSDDPQPIIVEPPTV